MSIYGALNIGVAGLDANSAALSVASSNIANVNTVGYKASNANFSTLLAAAMTGSSDNEQSVVESSTQNVSTQGNITTASSPTNLAISGTGFFVVSQSPAQSGTTQGQFYTRAGDFEPDSEGNLVNSAGYYLMGWPLDSTGALPTDRNNMTAINVSNLSGKAKPSTTVSLQANLQSSTTAVTTYNPGDMTAGNVTPDFQRTINVYDSQGGTQPLQVSYVKTGANTWAYEVSYQGAASNITGSNPIAEGTMSFNSDGTLANADTSQATPTGSMNVTIPWSAASGLSSQTISLNMGTVGSSNGVTQFDSASTLTNSTVDGALFGNLTGVTIDKDGFVTANFSNGLSQKIYQLPLATFTNPDGLQAVSGNAYQASGNSGVATVNVANTGGAGSMSSNALEASTVDLATEFTNLITTQRAYEASSKIITTAAQMLDQLMQMQS
jgi:flagellar hook protein FlgE